MGILDNHIVWVFDSDEAASAAMDVFETDAAFQCLVHSQQATWPRSLTLESIPLDVQGIATYGDRQIVRGQDTTYTNENNRDHERRYFANTWIQVGRAVTYIAPQAHDAENIGSDSHVARSIAAAATALDAEFGSGAS